MKAIAQRAGMGINEAAFYAVARNDELSGHGILAGHRCRHRLDRRAGTARAKMLAPVDIEAAIGGLEWGDVDAAPCQPRYPHGVRSEPRPACAAKREENRIGLHDLFSLRRVEDQPVAVKTPPAMPCQNFDALFAQPRHPGTQKR